MSSKLEKGTEIIDYNTYTSDNRGNILTRTREALAARTNRGALPEKTEAFDYDGLDRLTSSVVNGSSAGTAAFTFDDFGNILTKTGVGTYNYTDSSRPNRLTSITRTGGTATQNFHYDGQGRIDHDWFTGVTGARERWFTYTSFGQVRSIIADNMPATSTAPGMITSWGRTTIDFAFGFDGNRLMQVKYQDEFNSGTGQGEVRRTTTTYLGGMDIEETEKRFASDFKTILREKKHYFGSGVFIERQKAPDGVEPTSEMDLVATTTFNFYHDDNLGSTDVVTNDAGDEEERQSFDPWGARRDSTTWEAGRSPSLPDANNSQPLVSSRHKAGYTGHEMLDDVGIIHMNGRIYDSEIGRFLSPDPIIQDPGDSQNYAAYAYVLNNPMRYTDPSGYSFWDYVNPLKVHKKIFEWKKKQLKKLLQLKKKLHKKLHRWIKKNYRAVITIVVAVVAVVTFQWYVLPELGTGLGAAIAAGAVYGAAASASLTAIQGGSWSDILRAGLQGAVTGAISAGIGYGLGQAFDGAIETAFKAGGDWVKGAELTFARAVADAAVGGGMSAATGGNFKDGFIGTGVSSLLSPMFGNIPVLGSTIAGRTAVAAVVGGTASVLTGGKFANGALSAGFMHLFNSELLNWISDAVSNLHQRQERKYRAEMEANGGIIRLTTDDLIREIVASRTELSIKAWRHAEENGDSLWGRSESTFGIICDFQSLDTPISSFGSAKIEIRSLDGVLVGTFSADEVNYIGVGAGFGLADMPAEFWTRSWLAHQHMTKPERYPTWTNPTKIRFSLFADSVSSMISNGWDSSATRRMADYLVRTSLK